MCLTDPGIARIGKIPESCVFAVFEICTRPVGTKFGKDQVFAKFSSILQLVKHDASLELIHRLMNQQILNRSKKCLQHLVSTNFLNRNIKKK